MVCTDPATVRSPRLVPVPPADPLLDSLALAGRATLDVLLDLPAPALIAVTGPSGSGKSTLARELAVRLRAALLHLDDLLIPEAERRAPGLLAKYELGAVDRYLARLLRGDPVTFTPFDGRARRRQGLRTIEPAPYIVVEGVVALFSPAVLAASTLRLYVDALPGVRLVRQFGRLDQEGLYRDLPREEVVARIKAKRTTEDPVVARQLACCHYLIDTSRDAPLVVPLPSATDLTASRRPQLASA